MKFFEYITSTKRSPGPLESEAVVACSDAGGGIEKMNLTMESLILAQDER